jgi:hypothetical protein
MSANNLFMAKDSESLVRSVPNANIECGLWISGMVVLAGMIDAIHNARIVEDHMHISCIGSAIEWSRRVDIEWCFRVV